ncbi:TIGR01210 family radical SAM protein, partial [Candidatus Heimdallarchaeota archaeon]
SWLEKDRLIDKEGTALVVILNSPGCKAAQSDMGGCSMCGYSNDTSEKIEPQQLIQQMKTALDKFAEKSFQSVKIFTSGSFLDPEEIPLEAQKEILVLLAKIKDVSEIIIETRPEFVNSTALENSKACLSGEQTLELGIGLESSNDYIRLNHINKGFTFKQFREAVSIGQEYDIRIKSYILLKPPFLTEKEAIADAEQSIIDAIKAGSRSISLNPVNIQNGTLVYQLWRAGLYRSPWFWSVRETIQKVFKRLNSEGLEDAVDRILCAPSGAGTIRGVHNCKECNSDFSRDLQDYSLHQDPTLLDQTFCLCYQTWKYMLEYETATRDLSLNRLENLNKTFH